MPEIKVGFRAVIGNENLPVLQGRHFPGIDVNVRVQLLHEHLQTATFKQSSDRRSVNTFPQAGNDASGHKNKFRFHIHSSHIHSSIKK